MAKNSGTPSVAGKYRKIRRWARRLADLARTPGGTSAVEFALAAPLLVGLLMPVADLGLAYSQQIQLDQAAQAGAQYASVHPWNNTSSAAIANIVTSTTGLTLLAADPISNPAPYQECRCPDGSSCNTPLCVGSSYYVIVNAQTAYSPIFRPSLLGNTNRLTATATVRVH